MTPDILPDIPRLHTVVAEALSVVLYVLLTGRARRRPLWLVGPMAVLAVGAVHALAKLLPLALWPLGMAAAVLTMGLVIAWATTATVRDVAYVTVRSFVLAELTAAIEWQLHCFYLLGQSTHSPAAIALLVGTDGLLLAVAWFFEKSLLGDDIHADSSALWVSGAIALISFVLSNVSFLGLRIPFTARPGPELFYVRSLVDLLGFLALHAHLAHLREMQRAVEVGELNAMLRRQHEEFQLAQRATDEVNRRHHDLKQFMALVRQADAGERGAALDALEASILDFGTAHDTGNPAMDTILGTKTRLAADRGVLLECLVDGAALSFIAPLDLAALFGNAIDNAIEHAATLSDPQHRAVMVTAQRKDGFVVATVENCREGDVDVDLDHPRSTKDDAADHGHGMRNMREIVEHHGGTISLRTPPGWVVVEILLPRPAVS